MILLEGFDFEPGNFEMRKLMPRLKKLQKL